MAAVNRDDDRLPAGVWAVNWTAAAGGDGKSWATALNTVQAAIDSASSGEEIWVATGSYSPGANINSTFLMKTGLSMYGGFAGDEKSRNERDPSLHVTELTGEALSSATRGGTTPTSWGSRFVYLTGTTTPQFYNASRPLGDDGVFFTDDDGLRLQVTSPCVNVPETNTTTFPVTAAPSVDCRGAVRPQGGFYDMGAYEQ